MLLLLGLHVIAGAVSFVLSVVPALSMVPLGFFLLIGLSQLLYVVPSVIVSYLLGQPATAQGFIIGAAITFAINAACWFSFGARPF